MRTVGIILLSVFFLAGSCEDFPGVKETIHIQNQTNHSIESSVALRNGPYYPDTSLVTIVNGSMQNTPPGRNAYFDYHGRGSIAERLEVSPLGLVSIYIFHPDTLAEYSDQEIIDDYKVLVRYDLTLSDLETLDFFVPYPPSEAMNGMRIYMP